MKRPINKTKTEAEEEMPRTESKHAQATISGQTIQKSQQTEARRAGAEEKRQQTEARWRKITRGDLLLSEVKLYYEIIGQGQPLLLHGNRQSHHIFHAYLPALATDFQVILMDSRAHGHSTMTKDYAEAAFSIRDMADDVRKLLDHLGIQKVTLLGYSDGANIALEFASRYPERTRAVIAVSGNASPAGLRFPVRIGTQLEGAVLDALQRHLPTGRFRTVLRRQLQTNRLLTDAPDLPAERLQRIVAPVLLLAGTRDLIKTSHTRWMASEIPHSRLCLIAGGTHQALFQQKEQCLREIHTFLEKFETAPHSPTPMESVDVCMFRSHPSS